MCFYPQDNSKGHLNGSLNRGWPSAPSSEAPVPRQGGFGDFPSPLCGDKAFFATAFRMLLNITLAHQEDGHLGKEVYLWYRHRFNFLSCREGSLLIGRECDAKA